MLARSIELYAKENIVLLSKRSVQQGNRRVHWTKPSEDVLKLNYDASFLLESRAVSWGFLVRDSDADDLMLCKRGEAR